MISTAVTEVDSLIYANSLVCTNSVFFFLLTLMFIKM